MAAQAAGPAETGIAVFRHVLMDLIEFRAFVTIGIGAWLVYGCLSDAWRGVTMFNIWRAEKPGRFWLLLLVQLTICGAILAYGIAQYLIATNRMYGLGYLGL
jgi:hypothetical protein